MKIYNYKEGKAFFENNVKMSISDVDYNVLFSGDKKTDAYNYVENKCAPNKYTEAKLSAMLEYMKNNKVEVVKREHDDIFITYIFENGSLVYFTNGDVETEKGDDSWEGYCSEMKEFDPDMFNE